MVTLIIGAGPAGLGAAYAASRVGPTFRILERSNQIGGHSTSHLFEGKIFDEGPHISFTKFRKLRELFDSNVKGQVISQDARVLNFIHGKWVTHPIMANLGELPNHVKDRVYSSYLETLQSHECVIENYEDWLRSTYGEQAFLEFFNPYTIKYWGVPPREMSLDWVEGRFFAPNPTVVYAGLEGINAQAHYVQTFYYPTQSGFSSFFDFPELASKISYNSEVVQVDTELRQVSLSNGEELSYTNLVSTMPISKLIPIINPGAPQEIIAASKRLRCTKAAIVNVRVSRYSGPRCHWFYVYGLDKYATRVTIQTAIREGTAALDKEVDIQVEVYEREGLTLGSGIESHVILELVEMGLFSIVHLINSEIKFLEFSNVLFDHARSTALKEIKGYLTSCDIISVGRFGSWDYLWSDESFLEGVSAIDVNLANDLKSEGE